MIQPTAKADAQWMAQAIRLAMAGRGTVEPNPMVGCILVRDDELLAEGRHEYYGGPHAEANALTACPPAMAAGATAYVTLEPCCHENKQTPPCAAALIAAGVARVVIGCLDPNPHVAGRGVRELQAAGIATAVGTLEDRARQLNAAYFACTLYKRPYVTLKWAESADGKVAGPLGTRLMIGNQTSLKAVHLLRAQCDAILVGIRTVEADNPLLTARGAAHAKAALRVVVDAELSIKPECELAQTTHLGPVLVYCSQRTYQTRQAAITALMSRKIEVVPLPGDIAHLSLKDLLADLYRRRVTHLLVEPGPRLARGFFDANLADRVWRFRSPVMIDEPSAPAAQPIDYPRIATVDLDGDNLDEHLNTDSPVFFSPSASPDFLAIQEALCVFPRAARI